MYFDPEVLEGIMALPSALPSPHHPAPLPTSSVAPIPTVIPTPEYVHYTAEDAGKRTLWVGFVVMLVSSLAFYIMAWRVPRQKRLFHVLTSFITTVSAISYYSMAVNDSTYNNVIRVWEPHQKGIPDTFHLEGRDVYWAHYVDWSITTPLLLLNLSFLAGLSGADILVTVVADLVMVLNGLFASMTTHRSVYWGYYAMSCLSYLVIVYQIAFNARTVAAGKDSKTKTFFGSIATFALLIWTAYPIIWAVSQGARILSVDGEIIAYAVLDILAKPVLGFWLLFTHDAMSASTLSIGGIWAHGLNSEGAIRVGDEEDVA